MHFSVQKEIEKLNEEKQLREKISPNLKQYLKRKN